MHGRHTYIIEDVRKYSLCLGCPTVSVILSVTQVYTDFQQQHHWDLNCWELFSCFMLTRTLCVHCLFYFPLFDEFPTIVITCLSDGVHLYAMILASLMYKVVFVYPLSPSAYVLCFACIFFLSY